MFPSCGPLFVLLCHHLHQPTCFQHCQHLLLFPNPLGQGLAKEVLTACSLNDICSHWSLKSMPSASFALCRSCQTHKLVFASANHTLYRSQVPGIKGKLWSSVPGVLGFSGRQGII